MKGFTKKAFKEWLLHTRQPAESTCAGKCVVARFLNTKCGVTANFWGLTYTIRDKDGVWSTAVLAPEWARGVAAAFDDEFPIGALVKAKDYRPVVLAAL